jgi:2-hydroxy-6-oxonona-2,4-dienedioate hydrolase/2-hydroxy-6-oxo-6-(2'-carboxyphenyl)-hexa-2,4-dienoate hydrolase
MWIEHLRSGRVGYLDAGGVRTRYLDAGENDAPLVLFLHGAGGHAEAFIKNLAPFAAAGYRAAAIDMLGHGLTDKPDGCRYDLADYACHVVDVLAELTSAPAHLVGESLGGGVAMRAALLAPERVATVAAVVGGGLGPLEPTEEERRGWERMLELSTRAYDAMDHAAWVARMQWLVHDPASMPDEMVRTRIALYEDPRMRRAAPAIYHGVADMLYRRRPGILTAEELERFPVPVFYFWTEHNPTTPPRVARAAHELTPVSEFDMLEGLGHWPQFEAPAVFNERLLQFVNQFADGNRRYGSVASAPSR